MQVVVPRSIKGYWERYYFDETISPYGAFTDFSYPKTSKWKDNKQYFLNEHVEYNDDLYVCLQSNIGRTPDDSANVDYWYKVGPAREWIMWGGDNSASGSILDNPSLYKPYDPNETTVLTGAIRSYFKDGLVYDYIAAMDNPTKDPVTGSLFDTQWVEIGLSALFACIDDRVNTKLKTNAQYRFEFRPDNIVDENGNIIGKTNYFAGCDFIGFFGLEGVYQITITIFPGEIQCENGDSYFKSVVDLGVSNWYEYYFTDFVFKDKVFFKIPPILPEQNLWITVLACDAVRGWDDPSQHCGQSFDQGTEDFSKCEERNFEIGTMIIGQTYDLGVSIYDPSFTIKSNFRYERDEFGYIKTVEKTNKWTNLSIPVMVDTETKIDRVRQLLESVKDKQCVFIGDERDQGFDSLMVLGFVDETTIPITPKVSKFNLEIKGAI